MTKLESLFQERDRLQRELDSIDGCQDSLIYKRRVNEIRHEELPRVHEQIRKVLAEGEE